MSTARAGWRAGLVVAIAEMIPEIVREVLFGELDGDGEDAGIVHQPQPVVAIVAPIPADAVVDDEYRRVDVMAAGSALCSSSG